MEEYTKEISKIGLAVAGVILGYAIIFAGVIVSAYWVVKMVWGA